MLKNNFYCRDLFGVVTDKPEVGLVDEKKEGDKSH
jgi:hypothetical protein